MKSTNVARKSQESPADTSYAVTPHDTNEIGDFVPRAIYVGTGGNINMMLEGDEVANVFVGVPSGSLLPLKARIILATSTTASDIVAVF
mgnify:CR=1 FL=1|jgi:hypothetical protein|tara:strand:- start:188 stop:454 length:267 start_codon:yes stop_codon:yes gene_type:complete